MYGAQANECRHGCLIRFENDVEMYGAQAEWSRCLRTDRFENDVEMYGAQAGLFTLHLKR